jgi:hypothetical protein
MKANFLSFLLLVSFLAAAHAVDLVTPAGTLYDIKVTRVEADGVRITHREGIAMVDFDDLPAAMQQEYGWTPEKSAARKAAREAEAKRIAEEERMAEEEPKRKKAEEAAKAAAANAKPDEAPAAGGVKLDPVTDEDVKASMAEAARLRAEIDSERNPKKAKAGAAESPAAPPARETVEKPVIPPPPPSPVGTISSIIGEEKAATGNRNLLIAAGVSAGIVLLLFILSIGKDKPRVR